MGDVMRTWLGVAAVCVGCGDGGGGGGTTDVLTCDDIEKAPLTQVPAPNWPEGLDQSVLDYQDFGGRYEVSNSCGDGIAIKLTAPPFETLEVITSPWATTTERCGCLNDPVYPDDTELDAVALVTGFEMFIESWPDPGVQGQLVIGDGAIYSPDEELEFRACGLKDIDPYLQSLYEQVGVVIRIAAGGSLEGTVTLAPADGSEVVVCSLSNFNEQE